MIQMKLAIRARPGSEAAWLAAVAENFEIGQVEVTEAPQEAEANEAEAVADAEKEAGALPRCETMAMAEAVADAKKEAGVRRRVAACWL